ncbi:MAG: DUF1667 domain-containing protein [Firmicutes bacterium]|nr:DUF1667 domain-containing protein [Bacillota bacterium]
MTKQLICIECPRGCELSVEIGGNVKNVVGNFCKKGLQYAKAECVCPARVLTTTVRLVDGRMLSVKTDRAMDKDKLFSVMREINKLAVSAPVRIGQILAQNIDGAGANIVATKSADILE